MSFLTSDALASLQDRVSEMQTDSTESTPQVEVSSRAEPTTDKTDVNTQVSSTSAKNEESEGHAVPYARFKSVNESKKQLQARNAELERQLNERKTEAKPEPKNEDVFGSNDFYKQYEDPTPDDDRYATLEKRIQTFELRNAQAELEMEIGAIGKKYPDVPAELLLQATINNPNTDLFEVAKEYTHFIHEVEERALARHRKEAPVAPRRTQSTGSTTIASDAPRPRTMADAKAAALSYIKQHGI